MTRCVWLFVCGVTILDTAFAWCNRHTIEFWEENPVQLWLATHFGVWACILLRVLSVAFAWSVISRASGRGQNIGMGVMLLIHVYLLLIYLYLFVELRKADALDNSTESGLLFLAV